MDGLVVLHSSQADENQVERMAQYCSVNKGREGVQGRMPGGGLPPGEPFVLRHRLPARTAFAQSDTDLAPERSHAPTDRKSHQCHDPYSIVDGTFNALY